MIFGEEVVLQIILMTGMDENPGNTERKLGNIRYALKVLIGAG